MSGSRQKPPRLVELPLHNRKARCLGRNNKDSYWIWHIQFGQHGGFVTSVRELEVILAELKRHDRG